MGLSGAAYQGSRFQGWRGAVWGRLLGSRDVWAATVPRCQQLPAPQGAGAPACPVSTHGSHVLVAEATSAAQLPWKASPHLTAPLPPAPHPSCSATVASAGPCSCNANKVLCNQAGCFPAGQACCLTAQGKGGCVAQCVGQGAVPNKCAGGQVGAGHRGCPNTPVCSSTQGWPCI